MKEGEALKLRRVLARTGETGLAPGDLLHGVAVLPVEWWDPKWIRDNIQPMLDGMDGNAITELQQPRRVAQKRRR